MVLLPRLQVIREGQTACTVFIADAELSPRTQTLPVWCFINSVASWHTGVASLQHSFGGCVAH